MKNVNYKIVIVIILVSILLSLALFGLNNASRSEKIENNELEKEIPSNEVNNSQKSNWVSTGDNIIIDGYEINLEGGKTSISVQLKNVDNSLHNIRFIDLMINDNNGSLLKIISAEMNIALNPNDTYILEVVENKVYEDNIKLDISVYE